MGGGGWMMREGGGGWVLVLGDGASLARGAVMLWRTRGSREGTMGNGMYLGGK